VCPAAKARAIALTSGGGAPRAIALATRRWLISGTVAQLTIAFVGAAGTAEKVAR
jgi:hypothetical protein